VKSCLVLLVLAIPAGARAERTVNVVATGTPFGADELASALRVRLPDGAPLAVTVQPAGDDRVRVAIGDTTRDLDLGGRAGPDAARLVALEIVDLALDDLAQMPPPEQHAHVAADLLGSASAWVGMLAGGTLDLSLAHGRVVAALELSAGERVIGDLHITAVPVRATIGWRSSGLELRAGLVAAPVFVSDGAGDRTVMPGATASARLHAGRFVLAAGADAYATQTTYELHTMTVVTPWIAPWIAIGMELTP
jgi:hypothetical protein